MFKKRMIIMRLLSCKWIHLYYVYSHTHSHSHSGKAPQSETYVHTRHWHTHRLILSEILIITRNIPWGHFLHVRWSACQHESLWLYITHCYKYPTSIRQGSVCCRIRSRNPPTGSESWTPDLVSDTEQEASLSQTAVQSCPTWQRNSCSTCRLFHMR